MPWFRADDKLHDHRKTRKAIRTHPDKRRDAGPLGLWTLAGTWSADNLTDGFVPADELDRWDEDGEALAGRLVDAGFWEAAEKDGEPGYQFVNWEERQPLKEEVEEKRAAARERMKSVRAKRREGRKDPGSPDGSREHDANVQANNTGTFARSSPNPDPTRPDPTRPSAAAAAEGAADAAPVDNSSDDLPGPLAVLRSHMQAHSLLATLRFDGLNTAQTADLVRLVETHGDQRLIDVAVNTFRRDRPPVFVSAFLGTWSALPPPGQALALVRPQYCDTHNTKLSPSGVCGSCRADQLAAGD